MGQVLIIILSLKREFGLITKVGKVIIPAVYDKLYYTNDQNIILVRIKKMGL
jgi:hypothetical protein